MGGSAGEKEEEGVLDSVDVLDGERGGLIRARRSASETAAPLCFDSMGAA